MTVFKTGTGKVFYIVNPGKRAKLRHPKLISLTLLIAICCLNTSVAVCQNKEQNPPIHLSSIDSITTKTIGNIEKRYRSITDKLLHSSAKTLRRLQRKEAQLQKKLASRDSTAAQQLFAQSRQQYDRLLKLTGDTSHNVASSFKNYIPNLDSLQTTFAFLQQRGIAIPGIPTEKLAQLQSASAQINQLQKQLQSATDIKEFIRQRKQQLQAEFDKLGLTKELKAFKKEAYYYQAQINEYKQLLSDPDKLINKALSLARNVPAFRDFMSRNSLLARLFPMPSGYGTAQALQGLQTRASVQQQIIQQVGASVNPQQYVQQQVSQAQSELNALKDKINKAGGGSSYLEMPDFKPNTQRTKSFWKRLEYGLNIQSQRPNGLLPVTSDIAATIGYKLNDKATTGIGVGYKLGWGKDIRHISMTSQGVSVRSYLDVKLKGSIWISGGFEYNYQHEFKKIEVLRDMDAWQRSGLVGVTKKYTIGKKKGNMQLLWDFLSYQQIPRTQPLKFRIGYIL